MGKRELVIIGAGPAGLTAAIYGKRSGLDVLVLEKGIPGGQINSTGEIENWTGVLHASGAELADSFRVHAEHFKAEFLETDLGIGSLADIGMILAGQVPVGLFDVRLRCVPLYSQHVVVITRRRRQHRLIRQIRTSPTGPESPTSPRPCTPRARSPSRSPVA